MALQECHECKAKISSEAKTCPQCGVIPKNKTNTASAIIGGIVAIGIIWFYFGGGLEKQVAKDMQKIEAQVANDMVDQYEIAKSSGTLIDVCVHAGMVTAGYIQAKDDANYEKWKKIEVADCEAAGISK
jgi:hypothetical protein